MLIRLFCQFTYACSNRLPLLRLREPCLWREDQILQSILYEAAHFYTDTYTHTHTHTVFFTPSHKHTSPCKHKPLWRHHSGTKGTHGRIYKHTHTHTHTISLSHTRGDPGYLLTVQYLHCGALGGLQCA